MDTKTVLILILIGYLIFWYYNPADGRTYLDMSVNKIKQTVSNLQLFGDNQCTDEYTPVCGDGETYSNICLAQKAGVATVTEGEC